MRKQTATSIAVPCDAGDVWGGARVGEDGGGIVGLVPVLHRGEERRGRLQSLSSLSLSLSLSPFHHIEVSVLSISLCP